MRLIRALSLLAFLLTCVGASADSVDPDLRRLIREAEKPKVQYGPARVGWNGPEQVAAARVVNPVYESLRSDSPAAIRRELRAIMVPDWRVVLVFAALIFGLRLRRGADIAVAPPVNVVPFPTLPHREAA